MWDLTLRYHENEQEALEYQNLLQAGFSVGEIGARFIVYITHQPNRQSRIS